MERYLQRVLKNWAAHQQPPENLRARLLMTATSHNYPLEAPANLRFYYHFDERAYLKPCPYPMPVLGSTKSIDFIWAFHLPIPALRMV